MRLARNRAVALSLIVAAVIALGACGSGKAKSASTTTTRPTTRAPAGSSAPATTSAPAQPSDNLTGLGATTAAWDAHHTADSTKSPGSSFLPKVTNAGELADEYATVNYGAGRVTSYSLQLPDGTSLAAAEAFIMQQLPTDAKETSSYHGTGADGGTCLFLNYQSPTLAQALAAPAIGDPQGIVGVELSSLTANLSDTFNSSDVNSGTVGITANTASTGC